MFTLNHSDISLRYNNSDDRKTHTRAKQWLQSQINLRGDINKRGKSDLYVFNTTQYEGDQYLFIQDNAPPHRAKTTQSFFQTNNIKLIDFPPNQPDFNRIELIWSKMKRIFKILAFENDIQTKEQGITLINNIQNNYIKEQDKASCINNLKCNYAASIENNGGVLIT
ncbi:hypothetical protein ABPG72_009086 [Tetrahymena utriculariae]